MNVSKELKKIENDINSLERRLTKLRQSGGGADHNILSSTHLDSLAGSVAQGDLITGNSTPKWGRLAKGTDGQYLRMNGSDPAWQDLGGGSVGESDIQFLDNFDDADIWFLWDAGHTDANRTVTELSSGQLEIAVANGTDGNWWSTANNAPRLMIGVPGFPCMIETKITYWASNNENEGGIVFCRYDGNAAASFIGASLAKDNLGNINIVALCAGSNFYAQTYSGSVPLWLRVYLSAFGRYNEAFYMYYSTDGTSWNEIGTGPYSNAGWSNDYGITCGLFAKNYGAFAASEYEFEYFLARRLFGPG